MSRNPVHNQASMQEKWIRQLKNEHKISEGERILIALSGGKDSVCLLLLFDGAKEKLGVELGACHVHHGIRGEEADRDAAFCRVLCEEHGIPFFLRKADVPAIAAKEKKGLEETARMVRYALLEEVAAENGYDKIATAHTASDQAETILFHLVRGSGFRGLKGIAAGRGCLVRPLLHFSSQEIQEFIAKNSVKHTWDSTNTDTIYTRNYLRAEILPALQKINPRVENALNRLGETANWMQALIKKECDRIETENGVFFTDGEAPLAALQPLCREESGYPVLYEALSRMAEKQNIAIDFTHFSSVLSLLKTPSRGKIIEIEKKIAFHIKGEKLVCEAAPHPGNLVESEMPLHEGTQFFGKDRLEIRISPKYSGKSKNIHKKLLIIHLASDKIKSGLSARAFRAGDRIRMNGMNRSVKKLLCDAHIPREYRSTLPLICDEEEIVWIPYFGLCDKARPENATEWREISLSGGKLSEIGQYIDQEKKTDAD